MKPLLVCTLLFWSFSAKSQTVFFKSNQQFTEKQLDNFYSAISIRDSLVVFNANDYKLYVYNKNTGKEKWVYTLGRKTSELQFIAGNYIWTNTDELDGLRLGIDGNNAKPLPFSVLSQPFIKDDIVYLTGIYEAGNLLAYDIKADSVLWYRFIAHGCQVQPYYLADKIVVNAEGHNWAQIGYDGKWMKPGCDAGEGVLPGSSCLEQFNMLSHDGKAVSGKTGEMLGLGEYDQPQCLTGEQQTFILNDGRLTILGNNLKKKYSKALFALSDTIEEDPYGYSKLIKANNDRLWILYNKKLIVFNTSKKALSKLIDLSTWDPGQVVADGNDLWLVSKNDGLLYGLRFD